MKPNNYITREEAAVIVAGAYDLQLNSDVSQFSDADQISDWAVPYVGALAGDEVLLGDNDSSYRPKDYMSRAEVASMLARAKQRDDNEELTKNVRVTLPTAMTDADGVYTIADITTENATLETLFGIDISVSESGEVGAYSISVYLGDVAIADGVNACLLYTSRCV